MPGVLESLAFLSALVDGKKFPIEVGDDIRRLIAEALHDNDLASRILQDAAYSEKREAVFELIEVPVTSVGAAWTVLFDVPTFRFPPRSIWIWFHYASGLATVPNLRLSVYDKSGRVQPRACQVANVSMGTGEGQSSLELPVPDNAVGLRLEGNFSVSRDVDLQCTVRNFRISAW